MYKMLVIMLSPRQSIGQALRTARISESMSQQALAEAVGISRTTLVQIEKGNDVQMSSVEKAAHALGLEFGILVESADLARRRQARAEQQAKLAASREKHLRIAVQFALGGEQPARLKREALRMVELWKEKQLCSPVYIERWQNILAAEPAQIAQTLLAMDEDPWGPALRQNTPFIGAATP
jgi:transcriptional regulator with XRE-family HTH domain